MSDARKLSSMDASFLYLETPEMPMHVGSMAIFRLPEDYKGDFFEEFKAMIASRLHVAPILKARLEKAPLDIDHPSWVEDDQFDIDRHIFRGSLPAPHDRATLERIVGWMHAKLLNRARPLWEFYVFEGMKDNEIGLYSKMHHACIDGGAGAALTNMIYDVTPVPRDVGKPAARKVEQEPRDIAATMIGRPRIEPELSSSSVTTVSRKVMSFSRLNESGYIGSMMMRVSREVSSMPSSRSYSQVRFCCAMSRRCSLLARRETTPDMAESCWSRKVRSRLSSSASQSSSAWTSSSNWSVWTL